MTRLLAIAWKELIQLRRDRLTLAMMVALPVMQLLLFGYAIDTDVRHISTVVFDQDLLPAGRDFQQRMVATGFYDIVDSVNSYDQIIIAMRADRARVALVIPPHYQADIAAGRTAHLQLVVDGSDPLTVASASNTAASLAAALNVELVMSRALPTGLTASAVSLEPTTWFNPDLRTAVYIVPGLIGVILTMTMVMLTSMAIARERERGTLEQLIVSPVRRSELVLGKIAPYIVVGYVQMALILMIGRLFFDVPIVGSLTLLFLLAAVFIGANLALGLFFSTLARTQQQAMQMSFFFLLPNILISGFMFPWEGMPKPVQWLSLGLPLTHFLRIVRGIALKGSGMEEVSMEFVWLASIFAALVVLASLKFHKNLD